MRKTRAACAALWMAGAQYAWAHGYEVSGRCSHWQAMAVRCTGSIDGAPLAGVRIDVLEDDGDAILVRGRLDVQGVFTFEKPGVPFYVLIEAKPGLTVEIDEGDID